MSGTGSGDGRGLGQEEVRSCAREGSALQNVAMIQLRPAGAGQNWRQRPFSGTGGAWVRVSAGRGLCAGPWAGVGRQRAEAAALVVARCAGVPSGGQGAPEESCLCPAGKFRDLALPPWSADSLFPADLFLLPLLVSGGLCLAVSVCLHLPPPS